MNSSLNPSPWPTSEAFPSVLSPTDDRWETVNGEPHPDCTENEVDQITAAVKARTFVPSHYPWLTFLRSGQAYTIPLCSGERTVKAIYLHRDDLPQFVPSASIVHNGFVTYQSTMVGNRDGPGMAYETAFTVKDSLVVPVAHAVCGDVSKHPGSPRDKEASLQAQRTWLTRFNGLAGDVAGTFIRTLLNPAYVEILDARADLTNPPCPGQTLDLNRFTTSVQINSSTPKLQVAGEARGAYSDNNHDALSFSVLLDASVLREGTDLNFSLSDPWPGHSAATR